MTEAYVIINRKPFCLWINKEVGIATCGYFASAKYMETEADEYITQISGNKFGWIDNRGGHYVTNSKHEMSRPTDEQIYTALGSNSRFAELCVKMKLIEPSGTWSIEMGPFMDGICMN